MAEIASTAQVVYICSVHMLLTSVLSSSSLTCDGYLHPTCNASLIVVFPLVAGYISCFEDVLEAQPRLHTR